MGYKYEMPGTCPVCEKKTKFVSHDTWYRDFLVCTSCGSVPRERALAAVLERSAPNWRQLAIHESSPSDRGISAKMRAECADFTVSQFFPDKPLGTMNAGFRNENLERQTFGAEVFDLVVTLDVMEHVNDPEAVFKDVARTLKPGGMYIFTVPTYKEKVTGERRAFYKPDGGIEFYAPAEYHGNPVSDAGSLVTFHYGYDLPELIYSWSGLQVEVCRFHDHHRGIIGEFTECYVARKI